MLNDHTFYLYPILYSTAFVYNIFISVHNRTPYEYWNPTCVVNTTVDPDFVKPHKCSSKMYFIFWKHDYLFCQSKRCTTHSIAPLKNIWIQYWFLPADVLKILHFHEDKNNKHKFCRSHHCPSVAIVWKAAVRNNTLASNLPSFFSAPTQALNITKLSTALDYFLWQVSSKFKY